MFNQISSSAFEPLQNIQIIYSSRYLSQVYITRKLMARLVESGKLHVGFRFICVRNIKLTLLQTKNGLHRVWCRHLKGKFVFVTQQIKSRRGSQNEARESERHWLSDHPSFSSFQSLPARILHTLYVDIPFMTTLTLEGQWVFINGLNSSEFHSLFEPLQVFSYHSQ